MYKNPLASDSGIDISYDDALSSSSPPPKGANKEPKGVPLISQECEQGAPAPARRRGAPPPATLLTLPLELRLEIYGYLLTLPTTRQRRRQQADRTKDARLHPAILRACRQLHAEALAFLLETNEFEAHPTLLASFPRLFPFPAGSPVRDAAQAARVRRLRVRVRLDVEVPDDGDGNGDEKVRQLSGLRELVLDVWQADWRAAGPRNLRRFEAVRGVGRARVVGSIGGFEDYARWLEDTMMCPPGEDVGPFVGEGCDALTLHS
ncbi:hypothetical protein DL770_003672 [Monosporascus sp. CRB-9-2]|nr:hypothetical protein DL770_003672 [Monosporascus sp. CRB-9-2]